MKTLLTLLLLFALIMPGSTEAATPPSSEPTIMAVRGRIVRIRVPAGFERVTLQQYVVPRNPARVRAQDRWRTISTKYPRGSQTVITLRIPTLLPKRYLRVFGIKVEPLPGNLLTGFTKFLPDPPEAVSPNVTGGGTLDVATGGVTSNLNGNSSPNGDVPTRAVAESDIWNVAGNRLYFFNELRGLQVFDLAKPAAPALLGTLRLPGAGEQMYLLGGTHAVLLKQAAPRIFGPIFSIGAPGLLVADTALAANRIAVAPPSSGSDSGEIVIADVSGGDPAEVSRVPYSGSLAESRLVGSVLYLATNVSRAATDTQPAEYGLQISSFDLANPAAPVLRGSIFLGGWANAVAATDRFFLVAKYADLPNVSWVANTIDLIDISAADGTMRRAGQALVNGTISSKFQMNIDGAVLTAVAQNWGSLGGDPDDLAFRPTSFTEVQTFSIADPNAPQRLAGLRLAPDESVRATRFDGDRVYVVTFRQQDPLFVVDLKNPANPAVSGHVEAPGFSTYIEPLGDRLVTIGLVDWKPAVSLFDVSDPATPKLLSQLLVAGASSWSQSEAVWNEKAFKVVPGENLILVPVSGNDATDGWFSRVQLLDLLPDKIVKRGAITHAFSPRRTALVDDCIVAISPTRLVTVDAANRDRPLVKADLEIAWSVNRVFQVGRHLVQIGGSADWNDDRTPKISVAPINDANETLNAIDLSAEPVCGSTVKDGVLYVAQRGDKTEPNGSVARSLTVSAFDLASLPVLRPLSRVITPTGLTFGELKALWPSPGILVWSGAGEAATVQLDEANTAPAVTGLFVGQVIVPRWFYAQSTRLAAFDFTRAQTPRFLSEVGAGRGVPWELSAPFAANGIVYLSYKFFGKSAPTADDSARVGRHFLVRVDYADPATPVVDDTEINLPGRLVGVAREGRLLFTVGQNYDVAAGKPKTGESALQVSAFDGAAAHLVDTLPLASSSQPIVIQNETIFSLALQPSYLWDWSPWRGDVRPTVALVAIPGWIGGPWWKENTQPSVLSVHRLDDAGKFTKLSEIEAARDSAMAVFGELVVTQGSGSTLHLFDASNLNALEKFADFSFSGWFSPDLNAADGGLESGLWVPLGRYGVETIAAPPALR